MVENLSHVLLVGDPLNMHTDSLLAQGVKCQNTKSSDQSPTAPGYKIHIISDFQENKLQKVD